MGTFSIWHWLVVIFVILVLFGGKGKIVNFFTDFAKGLKAFKKGLEEEDLTSSKKLSSKKSSKV